MEEARSIAAAQTLPRRGDVDANVEQHLRLVGAAAAERVRLVLFPELSLTGYELDLARDLAFTEEDPRLVPLRDAAVAHGMTLVVGAPVRQGERLHIGALVLGPDRRVELYTKRHLGAFPAAANPGGPVPPPEASIFEPGDRDPLLQLGGAPAALAICADVGRASHAEAAARRGARSYLASMFLTPADLEPESAQLRSYAACHSMAVALANFGGPTGGLASGGRSAIWSEEGELLTRLEEAGAGLAIARESAAGWAARSLPLDLP